MKDTIWPFFGLRVTTPRLELRFIDDDLGAALAALAAEGIHDPGTMPFSIPWTDVPSPQRERNTLQFYWRTRAELTPTDWNLNFAVLVDGQVVGTTGLMAHDFPLLREFATGSWLGRAHQGQGIGKEMRLATLQLGFDAFGAAWATSSAWADNAPSLGVTRSLGYQLRGTHRAARRDRADTTLAYELSRDDWAARLRRDDIVIEGAEACLPLLGVVDG